MSSELVELREWVIGKATDLPSEGLTDDLPLLERRHLTSLHIPELILLLERLRGSAIDIDRLRAEDFRDIRTIAQRFLPDSGETQAASAVDRSAESIPEQSTSEQFGTELGHIGLGWQASGHAVLSGPLYRLAEDCDRGFTVLADAWQAEPEEHPAMVDAAGLQDIDYLSSFPHLATFPVCLDGDETNLRDFIAEEPLDNGGAVRLARTAPVREVLTPAACYHVFLHHRGEQLTSARHITVRNTCFRREAHYEPLRRQWSFRMREIVCIGTREEVAEHLERTRAAVDALCRELDLKVMWEVATDPFFEPSQNPKYLAQRVQPTKHEARFVGDLAIASVNMHEEHFGAAYGITRDGRPAVSGCVAFGIERWLYALVQRHGSRPADWPDITAAARRAAAAISPGVS